MAEKVSTMEVRRRIGDMLNRVALRHDEFVIERKGQPMAALVPVSKLTAMQEAARGHALEFFEQQKRRPGTAPSERAAMLLATEAQRWARAQKRRQRTSKQRHK